MRAPMGTKLPLSVLVVVHTAALQVLLLERAAQPGFWQSVTGSREPDDPDLLATARRELLEETGLTLGTLTDWRIVNRYEIWQFYDVGHQGRFRPRVIYSGYGSYYLDDGRPYPWISNHSLDFMPYAISP